MKSTRLSFSQSSNPRPYDAEFDGELEDQDDDGEEEAKTWKEENRKL